MEGRVAATVVLLLLVAVTLIEAYQRHHIDWNGDVRECYGTFNGFSVSGKAAFRYKELKARYSGCNRVLGNLEIAFLDDEDYDMSFLSEIREIIGYVIVIGNSFTKLSLPNLEAIRGFPSFFKDDLKKSFALYVALNTRKNGPGYLEQVHLPRLREITTGAVGFQRNDALCHINTIKWFAMQRASPETVMDIIQVNPNCPPCHEDCFNATTSVARCWGPSKDDCQTYGPIPQTASKIPDVCRSKVSEICRSVAKDVTKTVTALTKSLKYITRRTRKLQRALKRHQPME